MIRDAVESDLAVLIEMMRGLYAHDSVPFHEERSRCAMLELMSARAYGRVSLIECEDEVAGYIVLTYGFSIEYGGRHGFIDELFVADEYRGRGLGTLAIEHATEDCRSLGMKMILLEVAFENERAHALYGRLGFREHGRRLMSRIC